MSNSKNALLNRSLVRELFPASERNVRPIIEDSNAPASNFNIEVNVVHNKFTNLFGLPDDNLCDENVSLVNAVATSSSPDAESIDDALAILDRNSRAYEQQLLGKDCVDKSSPTNPMEDANESQINDDENVNNDAFEVLPER